MLESYKVPGIKMHKKTQEQKIYESLDTMMDGGISEVEVMYTTIENRYKIPRPTVRKFAMKYRLKLKRNFEILNKNCRYEKVIY